MVFLFRAVLTVLVLLFSFPLLAQEGRPVVLVTGASSGIGKALVERFAKEGGYKVYGATRQSNLVGAAAGYELIQMDPGVTSSVEKAVAAIDKTEQRLDLLINVAGLMVLGSVESIDPDDQLLPMFNVNVVGYARTTRAVVPIMRRNGGGRIINISSIQALEPRGLQESYSATRAAIEALSLGQSSYLKDDGIDVLVYEPGATRTGLMRFSPMGKHRVVGDKTEHYLPQFVDMLDKRLASGMSPDVVADQIYHLSRKKQPDFRTVASSAVMQRVEAVYVDPTGNSLREKLKKKYDQFVKDALKGASK